MLLLNLNQKNKIFPYKCFFKLLNVLPTIPSFPKFISWYLNNCFENLFNQIINYINLILLSLLKKISKNNGLY